MSAENDIRTRIMFLGENILEGLEHIHRLVAQGDGQHTLELLTDVLEGFQSIEEAISVVKTSNPNEMLALTSRLRSSFDFLVTAYEQNDEFLMHSLLENDVLLNYRVWLDYLKDQ